MLNIASIKQLAWHELRGKAHQSSEETPSAGQTARELGIIRGLRVLDSGVDDGADPRTDACPNKGSTDDRCGRVPCPDKQDFIPLQ